MRRVKMASRLVPLLVSCAVWVSPLTADEEELIRQYNQVISSLNAEKFDQARKELDAFEGTAKGVKASDPEYKRAQELLKSTSDLRINSYHNSAIKSKNAANEAVEAVKLDEAAKQLAQFAADSAALVKLRPGDKRYQQQQSEAKQELAQVEVVQTLLVGKPIDSKQLTAAAAEKPKQLFQAAPGFALARIDQTQWVSPLDKPGEVVVAQIFQAADETALFAAQTAQALTRQFAPQGLQMVSISIDEGEGLAKLDEFVRSQKPAWPVLLDDRGDFSQKYLKGSLRIPVYIVVGRDRQAWYVNGSGTLDTTAMLAAKVQEEIGKSPDGFPAGSVSAFPPAQPFPATSVANALPATVSFGEKPSLMVVAYKPDDGPHIAELAALSKQHGDRLNVLAVVRSDKFAEIRELAGKHATAFYQVRGDLPECYEPHFSPRLVLVTRGGRVLKVAPLSNDAEHVRAVLSRYAALLMKPGAYPAAADAPLGTNLLHRLAGGSVAGVTSRQKGSEQRLNDGTSGGPFWEPGNKLPQEITLSFLDGAPAALDRLTIDRRSGLGQFEVLAGQSPEGPFRLLGKFQADEREGRQAFELPKTEARFLRLRLLSTVGERNARVEIGEIEVEEAAGSQPPLSQRLAAFHAGNDGFQTDFSKPELTFWERTDFGSGLDNLEWRSEGGHLEVSGLQPIRDLRASALLHALPAVADFRLQATVQSSGNQAGGIVFGFRDWDNFLRVVLVQGHVQTNRSEGNSIRLERWNQGRLEVLGVHGEAFPHGDPIRLEVLRQGEKLAVAAQDKLIFSLDSVLASTGRVGFCAAGGSALEVDDIRLSSLAAGAPWNSPPMGPLTTAGGASLAWLNSQGDDQQAATWASNLLRTSVFSPPAAWEASRIGEEFPEAVFAFRDHAIVTLEGVEFELPARTGAETKNLVRKVEVLVSNDSPLDLGAFRSIGQFSLEPKAGPQKFSLKNPAACRYLKLRLLENGGGDRFALARFDVRLGTKPQNTNPLTERGRIEQEFKTAADDAEQEPNDEVAKANPLRDGKSLAAAVQAGETDFFRLPPPPAGKGLKTLRVTLEALPWLRLKAALCDDSGAPLDPPLAQFAAGQHAEQARQFGPTARPPSYVRVEMPPASLALILDTSGSMGGREEDVRAAVKSYLAGAADTEQIEVIEFNTDVGVIGRLPEDRQKVNEAIEGLGVTGNTALYQALLAGMEKNQGVILLSDGMNTVFKADFPDLCRQLGKKPVPIYAIGIGWDLHEYDANSGNTAFNLLQNLARQTGGQFYFSPESQQLTDLYGKIAAEVRGQTRYRLRAKWEVNERTVELAAIHRPPAAQRAFFQPLPPELPELAIGGPARLSSGPKSGGMPPGEVDLAPLPPRRGSRGISIARLPGLQATELASLPLRSPSRPRPALLPELIEVRVSYTPPKPGDPPLPAAVLPAFELIFDSSDSMKEPLEGKPKIEVARKVISDLAEGFPANAQVGLRLYGHWGPWVARRTDPKSPMVPWEDPRLNIDSELVVPIGLVNAKQRAELKRWINWTQPRGKTPMVYSLLQARQDFSGGWKGPRTVILVSDGLETCGGKLADLSKAYEGTEIEAVIHVVGFDIAGTDAEKQLRQIAKIGGGEYFGAQNAKQLGDALKAVAMAGAFAVYDESGKLAGKGTVNGAPVPLLPGNYRVRLPQVKADELEIPVTNGPALRLILNEDGSLKGP